MNRNIVKYLQKSYIFASVIEILGSTVIYKRISIKKCIIF